MSRPSGGKWIARNDKEAEKIWLKLERIIVRLGERKLLNKSDSWWLMNVMVRWGRGDDLRADLHEQSHKRGRAAGSNQDQEIFLRYIVLRRDGFKPKKAIGQIATEFDRPDASVRRIIRRFKKDKPYFGSVIT